MVKKVYWSHPMELDGQGLLDGSGRRALEAQRLLGPQFKVWIPEQHQADNHMVQQKIDLDALMGCDIVVADYYHFGLTVNGGLILGKGTNQEVGFTKGLNKVRRKKVPIVQITRQTKNFHCFDVQDSYQNYGIVQNVNSLEEACDLLKKLYGKK